MMASFRNIAILLATAALSGTALAEGNAENGETVFRKCSACHAVGPKARNKVGPHLNQIIGRKAGSLENYSYSAAFKALEEKGFIWDEETLFEYLEKPRDLVERTKMVFAGLRDEADRKDLIAYLKKFSQ